MTFVVIYILYFYLNDKKNMKKLLIPGRHLLHTNTQHKLLEDTIQKRWDISSILFATTSANHTNTKRNPVWFHRRVEGTTWFSTDLSVPAYIYPINDIWHSDDFWRYTIETIKVLSQNEWFPQDITPENTIIWCSSPEVIKLYEKLWYEVLSLERDKESESHKALLPWQVLEHAVDVTLQWKNAFEDDIILSNMHKSSYDMYKKYNYFKFISELHQDKILMEDWDLTEARDYNTYWRSFEDWAKRKFDSINKNIQPWKIVDLWCATGWLLKEVANDPRFHDSDLYWIDIARPFIVEANHKKEQWAFNTDNIRFYQKNAIDDKIFPDNSINTFSTVALTHEIISYDSRKKLDHFLKNMHDQLVSWWALLNFDVIWPENWEEKIFAKLETKDWSQFDKKEFDIIMNRYNALIKKWSDNIKEAKTLLSDYIQSLSTFWKLNVFQETFRQEQREEKIKFDLRREEWLINIKKSDIYEFLSKKDYPDNWMSEMNEKFCSLACSDRQEILESHWFEATVEPIKNKWIHENRYEWKVSLFKMKDDMEMWEKIPFEETNVNIVARKSK